MPMYDANGKQYIVGSFVAESKVRRSSGRETATVEECGLRTECQKRVKFDGVNYWLLPERILLVPDIKRARVRYA